jgi:excisionase family DNA binding protein
MDEAARLDIAPRPTLDLIATDPTVVQTLSRAALEALAIHAVTVHAAITTALLTGDGKPNSEAKSSADDGEERLLTVPDVARRLGVPPAYVYELARRRGIPTCRLGRYVRIPARELRTWIQERRVDIGPRAVRQSARAKGR